MHRQQGLLQTFGQRRSQIFSNRDKMARQTGRFRQNGYLRSFAVVKGGIIIVAKGSGGHLFCQNQVDEFVLGTGKNVTDFPARNIGFNLSLVQKFESLLRKE